MFSFFKKLWTDKKQQPAMYPIDENMIEKMAKEFDDELKRTGIVIAKKAEHNETVKTVETAETVQTANDPVKTTCISKPEVAVQEPEKIDVRLNAFNLEAESKIFLKLCNQSRTKRQHADKIKMLIESFSICCHLLKREGAAVFSHMSMAIFYAFIYIDKTKFDKNALNLYLKSCQNIYDGMQILSNNSTIHVFGINKDIRCANNKISNEFWDMVELSNKSSYNFITSLMKKKETKRNSLTEYRHLIQNSLSIALAMRANETFEDVAPIASSIILCGEDKWKEELLKKSSIIPWNVYYS